VLTSFLGHRDRFSDFELTIRPVQLSGSTSLPIHPRPFERFDAIFRVLERIDPENPHGFYHLFERRDEKPAPGSLESMIDFVINVDAAARILLEFGLVAAIEKATDEQTRNMLRDSVPAVREHDIDAVQRLLSLVDEPQGAEAEKKIVQRMRSRIATLDRFANACVSVRESFAAQLKDLEVEEKKE
jgi:hypothetical protein